MGWSFFLGFGISSVALVEGVVVLLALVLGPVEAGALSVAVVEEGVRCSRVALPVVVVTAAVVW